MTKRLGKRMLKFRWEMLHGKWAVVFEHENRLFAEMVLEMLSRHRIAANIRLTGALAGLGGYPFGTRFAGSAFVVEVPERLAGRAMKIVGRFE